MKVKQTKILKKTVESGTITVWEIDTREIMGFFIFSKKLGKLNFFERREKNIRENFFDIAGSILQGGKFRCSKLFL